MEVIYAVAKKWFQTVYNNLEELNQDTDVHYPACILNERNRSLDFNTKRVTINYGLALLDKGEHKHVVKYLMEKTRKFLISLYVDEKIKPMSVMITPGIEKYTDVVSGVQVNFSITIKDNILC